MAVDLKGIPMWDQHYWQAEREINGISILRDVLMGGGGETIELRYQEMHDDLVLIPSLDDNSWELISHDPLSFYVNALDMCGPDKKVWLPYEIGKISYNPRAKNDQRFVSVNPRFNKDIQKEIRYLLNGLVDLEATEMELKTRNALKKVVISKGNNLAQMLQEQA